MHPRLPSVCAFAVLLALVACGSTPGTAVSAARPPPTVAAPAPAAPAALARPATVPAPAASTAALPAHLDTASPISRDRAVHFVFDSAAIDASGRGPIERHGRFLAGQPSLALRIEGYADERGSAEYDLALGRRCCEAARRALALAGVAASRVAATSWDEERPQEQGHDEAAWRVKRRAVIARPQR